MPRLPRNFYRRDPVALARALLGQALVRVLDDGARLRVTDLCSGPAKLAQALRLDRALDGADLVTGSALFLERGPPVAAEQVIAAPRIGVAYAGEWAREPLRFYVAGNPHVSRTRPR